MTVAAPRRISVVGVSGSGKTTLARELANDLGLDHLELDAVYHQADWTPLPDPIFRERVAAFVAQRDAWIACGNYSVVQPLLWEHATDVVVLDPPRHTVMGRLVPRTLRRTLTRQVLWNGNRERWTNLTSLDPEQSILAWAWTQHARYRLRYQRDAADPRWASLRFHFVRSAADRSSLVTPLATPASTDDR